MRSIPLLVPAICVVGCLACEPTGREPSDKQASRSGDEEACYDDPTTIKDECAEMRSVTARPVGVRTTLRLVDSIGTTDPGRSRGEGPIPFDFLTGGGTIRLAAGVPVASSVHMYSNASLRSGADGLADTVLAEEAGSEFGSAVADMGDVFSDGIGALAVGAPGLDAVYLYELGVPTTSEARFASLAQLEGDAGTGVGRALAVGDFTGDGSTDLVIAADGLGEHGGLFIVSDLTYGPTALASAAVQVTGTADAPLDGAVVSLGDLDGDGSDELAVGSTSTSTVSVFQGGEAWATEGGTAEDAHTTLTGTEGGALGTAIAAVGDLDNDAIEDILIGEPDNSVQAEAAGAVYRVSADQLLAGGTVAIVDIALQALYGEMNGAGTGASVSAGGDENGDGAAEAIIGSPWFEDLEGQTATGAVHFVQDTELTGNVTTASISYSGDAAGARLGAQVRGGVDIDGDGRSDVAVGVGGADTIEVLLTGG